MGKIKKKEQAILDLLSIESYITSELQDDLDTKDDNYMKEYDAIKRRFKRLYKYLITRR
jgi:hypothetical protein